MSARRRWFAIVVWTLGLLLAATVAMAHAQDVEAGRETYEKWCSECHGMEGAGDGPAADHMLPRPRDFKQARYQVRTTAAGELPTDADILAILEDGMPGTTMPGWPNLSDAEKRDVMAYIKSFSRFFENADPQAIEFASNPGTGDDGLATGAAAYEVLECWKCHGTSGRGSGQSTPTLEDWREFPIRAADLTEPWNFNGGGGAENIYRRMMTGLDGTPMPAYSDAVASGVVTPDELWQVAHYVASLAPTLEPRTADLVSATRVESLPSGPDDEAWGESAAYFVPLVGQVIETPRNFSPTVDGVWIRALHDGTAIALRLEWGDPSESPDADWDEWQTKIVATLYADDADLANTAGLADGLAVQLPASPPDGPERPYFLMGSERDPVTLWLWDSRRGAAEAEGRGLGRISDAPGGGGLTGEATWDEGHWKLVLSRSLKPGAEGTLPLSEGSVIPMALFAWDGSSAETPQRGSVSSWIYLYLEEPASSSVVIAPLVAILLSGLMLFLLVRAAQRKAATARA